MNQLEIEKNILALTRSRTRNIFPLITKNHLNFNIDRTSRQYKVAVCLAGGLRHFEQAQSFANKFLIEPLNADVFFFGWSNKEGIFKNTEQIKKYLNLKDFKINEISNTKLPVPIVLREKFSIAEEGVEQRCQTILGQFYNIYNSINLALQFDNYDIIIRARPDAFFYSKIQDSDMDVVFTNKVLGIPQNYLSIYCGLTTDMFAMGNKENMKIYSKIYEHLEEYCNSAPAGTGAEFFVHHHLFAKFNLGIHNIDMPFMLDFPNDYGPGGEANKHHRLVYQNDAPKI